MPLFTRVPRPRPASALLAGALALVLAAPASAGVVPGPGSDGIGDDYFPLDGNGGIDVVSYEIHDRYRFGSGRLSGRTDVTLQATEALSSFNLDLLLPVKSVLIDGEPVDWQKPDPHELEITPAVPLLPGDLVTVRVRYDGKPETIGYLGERNWLADGREVVAMNQPHMAPWWFPANDHPRDKALVDISITVPRKREVVANGHLVSREVNKKKGLATVRWRADEPMAPYLAFFAAGDFAVASGTSSTGLPWYVAVSERLDDRRSAMRLMKRHDDIVEVLEQDLGDYPFSTTGGLATALDSGFALENQTRPTYSPHSLNTETVVHELAHQWFGDRVALENWRDIWLNEGPATYYEWRFDELRGGSSVQDNLDFWYRESGFGSQFWSVSIADPGADNIFGWPVYYRGGMTLAALRNRIGDTEFEALMLDWVTDRDHGSTEDFTALAETVSGEDLDGFFEAWLGSGKPADTAANGLG